MTRVNYMNLAHKIKQNRKAKTKPKNNGDN